MPRMKPAEWTISRPWSLTGHDAGKRRAHHYGVVWIVEPGDGKAMVRKVEKMLMKLDLHTSGYQIDTTAYGTVHSYVRFVFGFCLLR